MHRPTLSRYLAGSTTAMAAAVVATMPAWVFVGCGSKGVGSAAGGAAGAPGGTIYTGGSGVVGITGGTAGSGRGGTGGGGIIATGGTDGGGIVATGGTGDGGTIATGGVTAIGGSRNMGGVSASGGARGDLLPMPCGPGTYGDQGDGSYLNPILPADYQNTDAVCVGNDYYYISATKALSPGMMVLHSNDLVNWTAIGHVVPDITQISARYSYDRMDGEQRGVWAGSIAHHDGLFYVYFTTPDEGLFVATAVNPAGPWSPLTNMMNAAGWDDPCPFWDDDGQAYLVMTNFATDPTNGKSYNIHLFKMGPGNTSLMANSGTIIHQSTGSEANKLLKLNGTYYHFFGEVTGEGRVPIVERSTSLSGPWQQHQLNHVTAADREPNQGRILQTAQGDWFFITHHGTPAWEGRPASLLPVTWVSGWPVAGTIGADGIGNMVWSGTMPVTGYPITRPQSSDDFSSPTLGPQWEWNFQPRAAMWSLTERPGFLRLRAFKALTAGDLLTTGNVLTQRPLRVKNNVATVRMDVSHMADGELAGFGFLGTTSGIIGIAQANGVRHFVFKQNQTVTTGAALPAPTTTVWLRTAWSATWATSGAATFQVSTDGTSFQPIGSSFTISDFGSFLGAKLVLFTVNDSQEAGYVDIDAFEYPCPS